MATDLWKHNLWDESVTKNKIPPDEVASGLISEIRRRFANLSDNDKLAIGIDDATMDSSRLFQLLEEGRIRALYDTDSPPGNPMYQIEMDLDGDGLFATIPDTLTSGAGLWKPERLIQRYKSQTLEDMEDEIINKRAATYLEAIRSRKGTIYGQRPESIPIEQRDIDEVNAFDQFLARTAAITHTKLNKFTRASSQALENFLGIEFWDQQFIDKQVEQNLEETRLLQMAIKERGLTDTTMYKGDIMTIGEGDEQRTIKSENILYDYISGHEGVKTKPYKDSRGIWTIGIGYRMDTNENKKIFAQNKYNNGRGYNTDDLISGKQQMTLKDVISMFIDDYLPNYMGLQDRKGPFNLYGDIFDFKKQENSYLLMALTDFNHWAGSELNKRTVSYEEDGRTKQKTKMSSGFIGSSTEFYKALRAFGKGDKERWGTFGDANTKTVMGQMTIDFNAYNDKGQFGMSKRIKDNADFMQMYHDGKYARLPSLDFFQIP